MKKKKKYSKVKKILMLLLTLIIVGAVTYVTTYEIIYTKNGGNKQVSSSKVTSISNKTEQNQDTAKNSTTKNITTNNSSDKTNNQNSVSQNEVTSKDIQVVQKDQTNNKQEFSKSVAVQYFQKSRNEYSNYEMTQTDYGYSLSSNGKVTFGLILFDAETSPETGLKYYGYKLQNLELVAQGGSGTIENGYIYEDGSVVVE